VQDEPNKKEESLEEIAARYSITRPKQSREFHQTETRLTTPGSGHAARSGKKGGLNFLDKIYDAL